MSGGKKGKAAAAPPTESQDALPVGTVVNGSWKLERVLGKGSFGFVYEARLVSHPEKGTFALKVVPVVGTGTNKLKKTNQSMQLALLYKEYCLYQMHFNGAGNDHVPLAVVPGGIYEQGATYASLAMPLLGRTLNQIREDMGGRLPWNAVAYIAVQMVRGVRGVGEGQSN